MLSNPIKLSSYFTFKDFIPKDMTSSLVYEFSCALNSVPVSYVEMTKRHLYQRMAEHAGRNARANKPLSFPLHSSIGIHSESCSCQIKNCSLTTSKLLAKTELKLGILERLHISQKRPTLMISSPSFLSWSFNHFIYCITQIYCCPNHQLMLS